MTAREFMTKLRELSRPGLFFKDDAGYIRTALEGACPICWLATQLGCNKGNWRTSFGDVYKDLGLGVEDAIDISLVADNKDRESLKNFDELRRELLAACGLS